MGLKKNTTVCLGVREMSAVLNSKKIDFLQLKHFLNYVSEIKNFNHQLYKETHFVHNAAF